MFLKRLIPHCLKITRKVAYVFLANIDPVLQMKIDHVDNLDLIVMDTMNHWIDEDEDLLNALKRINILILNDVVKLGCFLVKMD